MIIYKSKEPQHCIFTTTGREKIGYSVEENVRLVLESDGTHVDDEEYLRWLPDSTTFLLLRTGESWNMPACHNSCISRGYCLSNSSTSPFPRAMCDALNSLEIHQEPPFWKIADNHGKISLVLHWDLPSSSKSRSLPVKLKRNPCDQFIMKTNSTVMSQPMSNLKIKLKNPIAVTDDKGPSSLPSPNGPFKASGHCTTQQNSDPFTSHNKTKSHAKNFRDCSVGVSLSNPREVVALSSQLDCGKDSEYPRSNVVPSNLQHSLERCEFHCGSLHEEGRSIRSSMCDTHHSIHSLGKISKATHVHFCDDASDIRASTANWTDRHSCHDVHAAAYEEKMCILQNNQDSKTDQESSYTIEDEFENETDLTTEKCLLLMDQMSNDQQKHLTILDLGVILERLKAKVIDVHRVEREIEDSRCFKWVINATIRGETLRDLGILYNGNYYSMCESPIHSFLPSNNFRNEEDCEDSI